MVKLTYNVGYIIHVYIRDKTVDIYKYSNILVGSIPWHLFFSNRCFPCEKLTLNVGYYF